MVLVLLIILMEVGMKEVGKMGCSMVKGYSVNLMEQSMWGVGRLLMVSHHTGMENTTMKMESSNTSGRMDN